MPRELPTISIVTPSFNRRDYLAETMASVLGQRYPCLEYVIVDGRSTDGSAELIAGRAQELAWWVSEPDGGAWEAINKGFAHTTGEVMGWLGSDDLLMPWSLSIIGELFATFPQLEWLTTRYPSECDEQGRVVTTYPLDVYSTEAFFRGANLPFAGWPSAGFIQQEATFWRRSLWERAGGRLDESLKLAADFELWARFHRADATLYPVNVPLAAFRRHGNQKSQSDFSGYLNEARDVLFRYGGKPPRGAALARVLRAIALRVVPKRLRIGAASVLLGVLGLDRDMLHVQPCIVHGGLNVGWQIEGLEGRDESLAREAAGGLQGAPNPREQPLTVICNGMLRSGSTWSYNVALGLLAQAYGGGAVWAGYDDDAAHFLHEAPSSAKALVLKCHLLDHVGRALALRGDARVVFTHRDPADVVASAMGMWDWSFEQALDSLRNALEVARFHRANGTAHFIDYDAIIKDPLRAAASLADYLGLAPARTDLTAIVEKNSLARMREKAHELESNSQGVRLVEVKGVSHDPETLLHPGHIRDGSSGYGRQALTVAQLAALEATVRLYESPSGYGVR